MPNSPKKLILALTVLALSGCFQQIARETSSVNPLPEQCKLQPETGKCKAAFKYFFFNQQSGKCQQFIYGGCGGVVPFKTLEACQSKCEE